MPKAHPGDRNLNPADIGFWALIAEDFRTHDKRIMAQGFWAILWHRFGNWRMGIQFQPIRLPFSVLYRFMAKLVEITAGIDLPYTVIVGRRVKLEHFGSMILVANRIGDDVTVRQNTTFGIADPKRIGELPVIGDRVDIGAGAVIIGNIKIGDGAVIGANAVVNRDVAPNTVVGGIPARPLKNRIQNDA